MSKKLKNQCDGCKRGLPIENRIHIDNKKSGYERFYMVCEANKYDLSELINDLIKQQCVIQRLREWIQEERYKKLQEKLIAAELISGFKFTNEVSDKISEEFNQETMEILFMEKKEL